MGELADQLREAELVARERARFQLRSLLRRGAFRPDELPAPLLLHAAEATPVEFVPSLDDPQPEGGHR